ncbi:MAG TPA: isoleucine--tRNA ligase [Candidatus Saccharimonadales bacterium]|nr:isoleucine--tRNA ligase [Candidatus Saccharimonadales bacterium]
MKFKKGMRRKALEYEKDLVQYWKTNKTFERSVEMRPQSNAYVFYDGPPFITGVPHHGTLLSSIAKDVVPRYWTMKGKRVERVWGWDCHGLPAEVFTEKKLGIQDKRDIGTKISLEEYITTCRENMVQTGSLWEDTIERIGRWVDFKGAYKTMDKNYMESVWWAFKRLYEAGKIYEGEKVLLYCTRDATPISKAEVAMDNSYQDVTDPSVYVKFELKDFNLPLPLKEPIGDTSSEKNRQKFIDMTAKVNEILKNHRDQKVSLLAWTTTPWTLPANTAVALNKDEQYALVFVDDQWLVLARDRIEDVMRNQKHQLLDVVVIKTFPGSELIGKEYEPLFEDRGKNAHKVWHADYVSLEEGTGIVHLAPAYGEEDYQLSREKGFPCISNIDDNGFYTSGEWEGQYVWDANKPIAKELHGRGVVWKIEYIRHSYPHCHRCGTKLVYRAHPSWFMDIAAQREAMLEQNGSINWFPEHLKRGRFAKTIESAPDWNLSRDRFWATAMPVWKGTDKDGNELVKVIGSYAELKELSGVELEDYHRPWIDDVSFTIDEVEYKRIDKVLDCWFESGSMPFAQFHYPFENVEKFEQSFPGDFIVEYVGQVRAWFYYLHAVSVGLFGKSSFKHVITTGTLSGNDGRKMSKSYGNFTDPNELMDVYSADALRFLLMSSPLMSGEDFSLMDKDVADVVRKLSMVWNMYDFFTLYAEVDGWDWNGEIKDPGQGLTNSLDVWIVSRVHQLIREVEYHMDAYDIANAIKPILPFLDDASNWYVRRSRRRFWKSGDDADKQDAYTTLHYVLVQLTHVMAPFTPFLAEELYVKLTGGESVHLRDWPEVGHVNEIVLDRMRITRGVINAGLSQRAMLGVKVRQPLQSVAYYAETRLPEEYEDIIAEELNVKEVDYNPEKATLVDESTGEDLYAKDQFNLANVVLDTEITPTLKREGMMREVVRNIQNARKQAGLNVDDRIKLGIIAEDKELAKAIDEHKNVITTETLATNLNHNAGYEYKAGCKVEGIELTISLEKA